MPQATTIDSPSSPTLPRLRRRAGFWLVITLAGALLLAGSGALLSSGLLLQASDSARRIMPERPAPVATGSVAPLQFPGFQRRGNLLTGHLTTEDGRRLHLVIDARSNTIIGAKLVEAQAPAAR
ncbi:MAG: hypothetical protein IOC64_07930 [Methylobacterium sp.]|jgi:hypothetical protein|nr:hypothetical protein [Methylobacterium sp.]MCA3598025.1 hypothetical protein [Methylobacterium sp.]MCA3601630.1 hypothetical protein [Methylobacterium sp.]MCA3603753.1 hypothetical protein [Methylobacterium sp.]MCA3606404.1 hypothetical protein [Methylobacterium sp.]